MSRLSDLAVDRDGDIFMTDEQLEFEDHSQTFENFFQHSIALRNGSDQQRRPSSPRDQMASPVRNHGLSQHPSSSMRTVLGIGHPPRAFNPSDDIFSFAPRPFGNFRRLPLPHPTLNSQTFQPEIGVPPQRDSRSTLSDQSLPRHGFAPTPQSPPTISPILQRPSEPSSPLPPLSSVFPGHLYRDITNSGPQYAPTQVREAQRSRPSDSVSQQESPSSSLVLRTRDSLELIEEGLLQPAQDPASQAKPNDPPERGTLVNAFDEVIRSAASSNNEFVQSETIRVRPRRFVPTWNPGWIPPNLTLPPIQPATSSTPETVVRLETQPQTPRPRHRRRMSRPSIPRIPCTACMEDFKLDDLVNLVCACRYCIPCLNAAFRAGCATVASFPPKCCGKPLRISVWGTMLEDDILERYKEIEAEFSTNRPLYCAFQKCSGFIPESEHLDAHDVGVCNRCKNSTCKRCRYLMDDHPCWDVERRICPADDPNLTALYALGNEKKWKQCPTCLNMVERTEGCNHMDCVCGVEFCYRCGKLFDEDDACDCDPNLWDEEEDFDEEDEEDEDSDGSEEEGWPNHRIAVDAMGRPSCLHDHTEPLGTNTFACHGCLRVRLLRSCNDCGLELCEACVVSVRQRGRQTRRDLDDTEDETEEDEDEEDISDESVADSLDDDDEDEDEAEGA